jgi:hypothetical protein
MTNEQFDSGNAESLGGLTSLSCDTVRAERVRARCRTELERSCRRAARTRLVTEYVWRAVPPLVVGAVCVVYAVALIATTLRLERGIR